MEFFLEALGALVDESLRFLGRRLRWVLNGVTFGWFGRWFDAWLFQDERRRQAAEAREKARSSAWEAQLAHLVGRTGRTTTWLRPKGHVEIDGKAYDARRAAGLIERDVAVRVVRAEGPLLYVEPVGPEAGERGEAR